MDCSTMSWDYCIYSNVDFRADYLVLDNQLEGSSLGDSFALSLSIPYLTAAIHISLGLQDIIHFRISMSVDGPYLALL